MENIHLPRRKLVDENGKEIKDIAQIVTQDDRILVITKDGNVYTNINL